MRKIYRATAFALDCGCLAKEFFVLKSTPDFPQKHSDDSARTFFGRVDLPYIVSLRARYLAGGAGAAFGWAKAA